MKEAASKLIDVGSGLIDAGSGLIDAGSGLMWHDAQGALMGHAQVCA
ncbi:MAG: hypothetical protein ACOVO6_06145 [Burkholderiaceae bacterium]